LNLKAYVNCANCYSIYMSGDLDDSRRKDCILSIAGRSVSNATHIKDCWAIGHRSATYWPHYNQPMFLIGQ